MIRLAYGEHCQKIYTAPQAVGWTIGHNPPVGWHMDEDAATSVHLLAPNIYI